MDPEQIANPETRLAISYAAPAARVALATLFALDARLGGIVARTTEPTIGLMRLIWWRDALAALESAPPPAEPLLAACAALDVPGAALAAMSEGWEALLDDPMLGEEAVACHASQRGARLFRLAGGLLGADEARLDQAGEGWAMVDLARHLGSSARAAGILASARAPLDMALQARWPRPLRPLGQMAVLASRDAHAGAVEPLATRRRLLRIARVHLTGR